MFNQPKGYNMEAKETELTPLQLETRATLPTAEAAKHLNRAPQTLRIWAMGGGPIKPLRVVGRLAWPVSEIKRLLGIQ